MRDKFLALLICIFVFGILNSAIALSVTETPIPVGSAINRWGVTNSEVNFRSAPAKSTLTLIRELPPGSLVWMYESMYNEANEVWTRVQVDGQDGYIMTEFINMMTQEQSDSYQAWLSTPMPMSSQDSLISTTPVPTIHPDQYSGDALTNRQVALRMEISNQDESILIVLPPKTLVSVVGQVFQESQTWSRVKTIDEVSGYVPDDSLSHITPDEAKYYKERDNVIQSTLTPSPSPVVYGYVTNDGVNFRSKPGGDRIRILKKYAFAMILSSSMENGITWHKVNYAGTEGYISGDFFHVLSPTELEGFLQSNEYVQGITDNTVKMEAWSDQDSSLQGTYEPFDPYEIKTPDILPTPTDNQETLIINTGNPTVPNMSKMKAIGTRLLIGDSSYFIDKNNVLWSWGANDYGQLGQGMESSHGSFVEPGKVMEDVDRVFGWGTYAMAIKKDHTLWAWGNNEYGYLGNGNFSNSSVPIQVMSNVADVKTDSVILALQQDGTLWAWGQNNGLIGSGTLENQNAPVKILENVRDMHIGFLFCMAIQKDDTLWAWGNNLHGNLGNGTYRDKTTPVKIMEDVKVVSSIHSTSYCLTNSGDLYAWGEYGMFNEINQLSGNEQTINSPKLVKKDVLMTSYTSSSSALAWLNTDGTIDCLTDKSMIGYAMYDYHQNIFSECNLVEINELHSFDDIQLEGSYWTGVQRINSFGVAIIDQSDNLWRWYASDGRVTLFDTSVETFLSDNMINLIVKADGSLWNCANDYGKWVLTGGPQLPFDPVKIYDLNYAWDILSSDSTEQRSSWERQSLDQRIKDAQAINQKREQEYMAALTEYQNAINNGADPDSLGTPPPLVTEPIPKI